ncbi:retrovirus-related pol polyprotein from transposon TNT 1-94 [Tanacetum coccineum]|uniref:Retrovirus-related pol polyprotein from transposon TNT 1-94 n=1 Tax=Tanacetum coccineum TaxID=301880 RepID=A0ABQ5CUT1_9ASTR
MTQESNSKTQKTESSKSVDSSRMSQDSKPKVQNTGSSKSLRPKPIQKPQLKCKLCHYTNNLTDDCYRILYCMICKREDHRTSDHEMYTASLKRSKNYKAQPYQYASSSKQILKAKAKPFPPCTHYGFNDHRPDDCRNYPECEICGSYNHSTSGHNRVIHIRGGVLAESSQSNECSIGVKCNTCGSTVHSTTNHNEFDHFKRGEKIQAAKAREPTKNRCSRSMTGVKSYLHKYVEQPGPKVVFGDNSSCITEGYGSINCGGIVFTKVAFVNGLKYNLISISQLCDAKYIVQFDDKQGTIFNANKEIVLIAPRRNDVYVLDMSSLTLNGACFFAKASESVNWLWHKRLSHLNFKNINKLAKQNKVLGLPSLVYSKDKPCTTCEKGKHHRASFKTKQNFSIRKCLHLLHMDLFGPVSPMSINHEKYTLVIVDEYSRYTWVHFLRKKSQAPEIVMSFIRMVENQNDVKVKQIRTDNGTEFRNHELESFCDEKGISQNFSSPYTPEQNGVAERKNITLIEAARTMLNGSVLSKHFWTEAVRIACYTQNRSIIVKRHDKTPYEIFRERILDISYFHVFGCPVFIHNHKDHLGKFDAKADDGYFLGYSFVSKAFRVFNTRRQQVEETYHVTFDENSDVSYYIISHGRSLTELTQENHVPEVIAPNEPEIPHTEDTEVPPDLINTEGTHEQNVQNDQMITQPTDVPSGNNIEVSGSITEPLVPDVTQSHISKQASTSMLTRSMVAKLIVASASECLFADFLSEIEPKKIQSCHQIWHHPRSPNNGGCGRLSTDYVPALREQSRHSSRQINVPGPGPEYPEYLAPSDEEVPVEDQPYAVADSPIALSPGYVADSDPEEDSEDGPVDYPADGGDGDDDDSSDDDEEEEEASEEEEAEEEEEEEHLAPADSVVAPVVDHVPSSEETEPFETDESAPTPRSPQTIVPFSQTRLRRARKTVRLEPPMSPSMEARIAEYAVAPTPPSPPPSPLSPWSSPLPQIPSPPLPPPPSSLHLPPHVPTSLPLPLPSLPLPPLPALLFIPPLANHREDTPEVGESSTAAPRPAGGHGIDYGFIGTLDVETKCQRAAEVGYRIRDTWVDPREEQDTQDIYAVIEDAQDGQTWIFQSVETLIDDRQYHYETVRLLDQEALVSQEAWAHTRGLSSAVHYELQGYRTHAWMQDHRIDARSEHFRLEIRLVQMLLRALNNMPPRRSSASARAVVAAARDTAVAAAAPMTVVAFE